MHDGGTLRKCESYKDIEECRDKKFTKSGLAEIDKYSTIAGNTIDLMRTSCENSMGKEVDDFVVVDTIYGYDEFRVPAYNAGYNFSVLRDSLADWLLNEDGTLVEADR